MQKRQWNVLERVVVGFGLVTCLGGIGGVVAAIVILALSPFYTLAVDLIKTTVEIPVWIFFLLMAAYGAAILIAAGITSEYQENLKESESKKP